MEVVKIKCFLVWRAGFCLTLLSEAVWSVQTLNQSGAGRGAELESFSCRPADVPHPHVLMAFYGSLESLWLLLTQWDSLQRQRGLQREGQPQYIADAKTQGKETLSGFWRDFNLWISGFNLEYISLFLMLWYLGLFFCFILSYHYVRASQGVGLCSQFL